MELLKLSSARSPFRLSTPKPAFAKPSLSNLSFTTKSLSVPNASLATLTTPPTFLPMVFSRETEEDVMTLMLKERTLFLGNNIDDLVADVIVSQLLLLDAQDPTKDIRLFIHSTGGSINASMAILDVVQLIRADVSTVALGISASTASLILGSGTKGKRFAMPNTRIMITQPLGGVSGHVSDVEIQAREAIESKKNVIGIISGFSGRTMKQVELDIERDRYMSASEAVEYGIIDGVIDSDKILPLPPFSSKAFTPLFSEFDDDAKSFLSPNVPDDEIF